MKNRLKRLPTVFPWFVLALGTALPVRATMLVVIYTPDGYWIGADSARQANGKRVGTVCKVHETTFGLLLKAGTSQGTSTSGSVYSTDEEIEGLLVASTNAEDFKASLRSRLKRDIEAELVYLENDSWLTPDGLPRTLMTTPIQEGLAQMLFRGVYLLQPDTTHSLGEALEVTPKSESEYDICSGKIGYHYSATASLDWVPIERLPSQVTGPKGLLSFPKSVRMFAHVVTYNRPDEWVQSNPADALLEILKQGNTDQPELVGPPYVIVHVTRTEGQNPQIQWIEKGLCPSWTEKVLQDDSMQVLRNPPQYHR